MSNVINAFECEIINNFILSNRIFDWHLRTPISTYFVYVRELHNNYKMNNIYNKFINYIIYVKHYISLGNNCINKVMYLHNLLLQKVLTNDNKLNYINYISNKKYYKIFVKILIFLILSLNTQNYHLCEYYGLTGNISGKKIIRKLDKCRQTIDKLIKCKETISFLISANYIPQLQSTELKRYICEFL